MNRANINLCPGTFAGGKIEPGTFHGGEIEPGTFHFIIRNGAPAMAGRPRDDEPLPVSLDVGPAFCLPVEQEPGQAPRSEQINLGQPMPASQAD